MNDQENKPGAEIESFDPDVQQWMAACQTLAGSIQKIADTYGVENMMRAMTFNLNSLFAFGLRGEASHEELMEEFITNLREECKDLKTVFKFDLKR